MRLIVLFCCLRGLKLGVLSFTFPFVLSIGLVSSIQQNATISFLVSALYFTIAGYLYYEKANRKVGFFLFFFIQLLNFPEVKHCTRGFVLFGGED
ncbi:hypothetical protein HOY80DRAFT_956500 [Tuber brumale]|nr:hypothetical protein HOY80DRAFT_956500 [Tuber brumale]